MNAALVALGVVLIVAGLALIPVAVNHGWRLPGPTALAIPGALVILGGWCIQVSMEK